MTFKSSLLTKTCNMTVKFVIVLEEICSGKCIIASMSSKYLKIAFYHYFLTFREIHTGEQNSKHTYFIVSNRVNTVSSIGRVLDS